MFDETIVSFDFCNFINLNWQGEKIKWLNSIKYCHQFELEYLPWFLMKNDHS